MADAAHGLFEEEPSAAASGAVKFVMRRRGLVARKPVVISSSDEENAERFFTPAVAKAAARAPPSPAHSNSSGASDDEPLHPLQPRRVAPAANPRQHAVQQLKCETSRLQAHYNEVDKYTLQVEDASPAVPRRPGPVKAARSAHCRALHALSAPDAQPAPNAHATPGHQSTGSEPAEAPSAGSSAGASSEEAASPDACTPAAAVVPSPPRTRASTRLAARRRLPMVVTPPTAPPSHFATPCGSFSTRSSARLLRSAVRTPLLAAPAQRPAASAAATTSAAETSAFLPACMAPCDEEAQSAAPHSAESEATPADGCLSFGAHTPMTCSTPSLASPSTPGSSSCASGCACSSEEACTPALQTSETRSAAPSSTSASQACLVATTPPSSSVSGASGSGPEVLTPQERLSRGRRDSPAAASSVDDLADAVSNVHLTDAAPRSGLQDLLHTCGVGEVEAFDAFLDAACGGAITKVGEGSFGEAFASDGAVLKVVPIEGEMRVNDDCQKRAAEMVGEVLVGGTLSALRTPAAALDDPAGPTSSTDGFVELRRAAVVRGAYPERLQRAWTAFADSACGSENDDPCVFGPEQLYLVLVCQNGGTDLESFPLRTFAEAKSMLLQTVLMLAVAEERCEFEHRDLHWGNLLLRPLAHREALSVRFRGRTVAIANAGVQVCLIDFTLSRLRTAAGRVAHSPLEEGQWLFEGQKGDPQMDTYRQMRDVARKDWEGFHPATNCCWVRYLCDVVAKLKEVSMTPAEKKALQGLRAAAINRRSRWSQGCRELMWHTFFADIRTIL